VTIVCPIQKVNQSIRQSINLRREGRWVRSASGDHAINHNPRPSRKFYPGYSPQSPPSPAPILGGSRIRSPLKFYFRKTPNLFLLDETILFFGGGGGGGAFALCRASEQFLFFGCGGSRGVGIRLFIVMLGKQGREVGLEGSGEMGSG